MQDDPETYRQDEEDKEELVPGREVWRLLVLGEPFPTSHDVAAHFFSRQDWQIG